jgi:hypothetical protein
MGPTANLPPPALTTPGPEIDQILTGATLDYRPQPGRTSPALRSDIAVKPSGKGGSAGWRHGRTSDENM